MEAGAAYLLAGPIDSDRTVDDAVWAVYGSEELETVGQAVGAAGDVNGDGTEDLLVVGAPGFRDTMDWQGAAYLWYGGGF